MSGTELGQPLARRKVSWNRNLGLANGSSAKGNEADDFESFLRAEISVMRRQLDVLSTAFTESQADLKRTLHYEVGDRPSCFSSTLHSQHSDYTDPTDPAVAGSSAVQSKPRLAHASTITTTAPVEDKGKCKLQKILEMYDKEQERQKQRKRPLWERLWKEKAEVNIVKEVKDFKRQEVEIFMESSIGVVILLNAIFIGVSTDHGDDLPRLFTTLDIAFSIIFWSEIGAKLWLHGATYLYCGRHALSNCFDTLLVILDTAELLTYLLVAGVKEQFMQAGVPSASLFRVIRLTRLARFIRLIPSDKFRSLLAMIQGMLGGMLTLGWAIVLFGIVVYVGALVCRELLGPGEIPNVSEYFSSVPRAMFTVFRCSFGDCSTRNGVPIFEYVEASHGWFSAALYCGFLFFMTVGIFNVISAIFVDSTMSAAAQQSIREKQKRLDDEVLWSLNVVTVIKRLLESDENGPGIDFEARDLEEMLEVEVPCSAFERLIKDPEVKEALDNLDIDPADHKRLSDVLDPDHTGTISMLELVNGLQSMRGQARRSDVVMLDLMVRNLQSETKLILASLRKIYRAIVHHHGGRHAHSSESHGPSRGHSRKSTKESNRDAPKPSVGFNIPDGRVVGSDGPFMVDL